MTDVERTLLEQLIGLENEVATAVAAGRKPEVMPWILRLRSMTAALPADSDPMLLHCLERQSWEKARLALQSRHAEISHGSCGTP